MKKGLKRALSVILSTVMAASSITFAGVTTVFADESVSITTTGGWYEAAYAEWQEVTGAEKYNAYYKVSGESNFTKIDDELVRGTRADVLGLKGGTSYNIKIVPVINGVEDESKAAVTDNIDVTAFAREGFAFSNGKTTGGYNEDGTVPENAQIIYVSDANKDTVEADVIINTDKGTVAHCTGISGILLAREKNGAETTPLIIRIDGVMSAPTSGSYTDGGSNNKSNSGIDSAGLLNIKSTQNVTIEGIGYESGITGFGLNIRDDSNIEIRNMRLGEQKDDCVSVQTDNDHIWIHHNDFYIGADGGGDKRKGDGSCDVKANSTYATVDYNHFHNTGKTSLGGMTSDKSNFFLTYHHNWYDTSGSRHPRARTGSIHVYNNYFDHNYSGGIAACLGASVFSEGNYFEDTVRPMFMAGQGNDIKSAGDSFSSSENGGVIKSYNNKITTCEEGTITYIDGDLKTVTKTCTGCTYWNGASKTMEVIADRTDFESKVSAEKREKGNYPDAYQADSRDEKVPSSFATLQGGNTYNNFDTDPSIMADYVANVQSPDVAKADVMANSGALKKGQSNVVIPDPTDPTSGTTASTTTTEAQTETTTEAVTETTTQAVPSTPVEIGEAVTGFVSDDTADTGNGISVTYNEKTDSWSLVDTSATAAAEITIPFAEQTSGKIIISGTAEPSTTASKWVFVQIRGTKEDGSASEIIGFGGGSNKTDLSVRVNGASAYTKIGTLEAKSYEYTIIFDLDNKTAEVTIDGITNTYNVDVASISSLYSTTSKTGSRNVTVSVPYVGVIGDAPVVTTTEATTEVTTLVTTTEATTEATTKEITTEASSETTTENVNPDPGFVYGDVDRNGTREILDCAILIDQIRNGYVEPVSGINDVTMDGKVDTADVATILQKILNSSYKMPCEPDEEYTTETTTEATTAEATTATPTTEATTEATTETTTETPAENPAGSLDELLNDTVKWDIGTYTANTDLGNGLTVLLDVAPVTDLASLFVARDGKTYEYSKAAESNNSMASSSNGDVIKFTAPYNGTFTIAFKVSGGKTGSVFGETVTAENGSAYYIRQYNVTAGQTYTAGLTGSKIRLFYLGYTPEGGSEETTEVTTTAVTTEATTTVATTEVTTEVTTTEATTTAVTTEVPAETTTEAVSSDSFYSFDDNPEVTKDGTSGITYTVSTKSGEVSDGLTAIASIVNGTLFLNDASATDTVKATLPLTEKTSGTVTYTAKITPSVAATKWTIVQLNGVMADDTEGEVLGIRTDGSKNYGLRVNAGSAVTATTVTSAANTQVTLVITVDFDNDTATLSVDGSSPVTVTGVDAKSITSMSFQTATGTRDLTVDDAGITDNVVEDSTEATTETPTEGTTTELPAGAVAHNFTTDGTTSTFFTIIGNLATDKGTVTYNGMVLTQCLKMETATSITFTAPSAGTLTLVFNSGDAKHNCKVDGTKLDSDANGVVTVDVEAGAHEITKRDSSNLYYMTFVAK